MDDPIIRFGKSFNLDPHLVQAVEAAEGGRDALLRAVKCSQEIDTYEEAVWITYRSAVHALHDFIVADPARKQAFIEFWGRRWCPVGAANDPTGLNRFWCSNVLKLWQTHDV